MFLLAYWVVSLGFSGILTWGIFFVPLAALCAIVGLLREGSLGGARQALEHRCWQGSLPR